MDRMEVWLRFACAALTGLLAHTDNDLGSGGTATDWKIKCIKERSADLADMMMVEYDAEYEAQKPEGCDGPN